jgi:xanthine dehydrogenase molybdopterin-binding subunit B
VLIHHPGHEIGQGLNTKVAQAAAYGLSKLSPASAPGAFIKLEKIVISDVNTDVLPNISMTGGSTTSEGCCASVMLCCEQLVHRLEPVRLKLLEKSDDPNHEPTWEKIVASAGDISLCSQAVLPKPTESSGVISADVTDAVKGYHNFGAATSEVEIDTLTGEVNITSTDIVYDCGTSLNPAIDLGQSEGGFVMGLGFYLREQCLIDSSTGELLSDGTWNYKPPCALDVPLQLNVEFLQDRPFTHGVLSSKASGEPPLVLATSVFVAVRHAVAAAREASGLDGPFDFNSPATVSAVAVACGQSLKTAVGE